MLAEPEMRHGAAFYGKQSGSEQRFREKAQRLWSLLRHGLQETKQKMKREDLQPQVLHHGPQLLCHVPFTNALKCATYIPMLHCFVTIDSAGYIQLQNREGHVVKHAHFTWPLSGALYAWQVQHYVVWSHEEMLLLDQSLSLVSRCPVPQGVTCSFYDSGRNHVLCGGCGGVTVWTFSHSGRNLSHHHFLSRGMTDQDTVTLVALDTTSRLPQSCFAVCKTSVWEYDLNTGDLLRVQKNLHLRKITGLLYSEFLQLLISGSRDGSIKIWNRDAQLKTVYLGHTGPVTALALDVPGMTVFSGSEDSTLRTWDLDSHEQVGEQQMTGTVLRLETFSEDEIYVVSQTSCFLDVWRVRKLYQLNTIMGTVVTDIKMSHRHHPSRALCVCDDSAVRLIAAGTGDVISSLLLEPGSRPLGAEYCEHTQSVFVLLEPGDLIKANVRLNPMSVESQIKLGSPGVPPLCFTLFSNIKDEARAERRETMEKSEHESTNVENQPGDRREDDLFLIIVGRRDGTLSVFECEKNSELFHFEAHCPAEVTSVISSPKENFILTAGSDMTIKVWRYFPSVEECFGLCLSFSCSQSVGLMCVLKSQLFVAFSDPSTAKYSLVQYDLQTQTRKDHSRGDDHQDQVTGLCPCPEVGLVATCGRDGTIRIWNQQNQLLRTLCLHVIPESLAFNKDRAELLVGIHSHVYHIDLSRLLPMPYRFKLQLMRLESSTDLPIPILDSSLKLMSEDDRRRLTKPHACTSRGHESPHKTWWEDLKKLQETKEQSQEHMRISARDQELQLLQEGRMRRSKKHKISKKMKREAMERYLQLLYGDRPSIKVPDFDSCEPGSLQMPPAPKTQEAPFMPFQGNKGFFSDSALGLSIQNLPRELRFPFQVLRWIPNSAILPMILPLQFLEKEQKEEEMMRRRLELFQNAYTDAADTVLSDGDASEEDVEETAVEEFMENKDILQKISQYEIKQDLLSSVDESLDPLIANEDETKPQVQRVQETQIRKVQRLLPSLLPNPPPQPHRIKSRVRPAHPVLPVPVVLETSSPPTPEVLEPRHKPSLPLFMLQFQETSWFSRIFPESQVERPPASEKECVSRLLQGLLHSGHPVRVEILQALGTLFHQGHIQATKEVLATLLQALNPFPELNLQLSEDHEFVSTALRFMVDLFPGDKDVILELLVMCVQDSPSHRPALLNLFSEMGVQDPLGFLKRKVNLWDNWEVMDRSRVPLRHQCARWLESWTSRLKDYVAQSLEASQSRSPAGRQGTRILKGRARALAQREQDMFEVTPVDALNYYCEVQMMKETQRQKKEPHAERSTVLALPPTQRRRALLRLGEDMSGRRRELDDVFLPWVPRPPPHGMIPFINLPMKKISLCPFSSMMDSSVTPYLTGSLKPDAHRYFVVHRSYAHSYS